VNTEGQQLEDYEVYLQAIPRLAAQYNQARSRPQDCKEVPVFNGTNILLRTDGVLTVP
jgi:hypothetical protein